MSQYGPSGYPPQGYGPPPTYPSHVAMVAPHRGGAVLTLGILSIVLCQLIGPFAWAMGSRDLAMMDRGEMDRMGRDTTQAGKICGIIGTVLLLLWVGLAFLQLVMGIAILGAAASSGP